MPTNNSLRTAHVGVGNAGGRGTRCASRPLQRERGAESVIIRRALRESLKPTGLLLKRRTASARQRASGLPRNRISPVRAVMMTSAQAHALLWVGSADPASPLERLSGTVRKSAIHDGTQGIEHRARVSCGQRRRGAAFRPRRRRMGRSSESANLGRPLGVLLKVWRDLSTIRGKISSD